jgi:predicted 3-demethylubiquinone-9 3-methyltransferase (glyoxalase superfamily)
MTRGAKVRTCLWLDQNGEKAARLYVSLLPGSGIERTYSPDPSKPPLLVDFTLCGTPYQILNGGPRYPHTEAASISVLTEDQAETDRLWSALTADGGREIQCGWLRDRYGLSWQIVPRCLIELLTDPDPGRAGRAMQAMLQMVKIDIAALESAAGQT